MCMCVLLQIVLDEAFPDLTEGGNQADVRTAIEQSGQLLAVSTGTHLPLGVSMQCLVLLSTTILQQHLCTPVYTHPPPPCLACVAVHVCRLTCMVLPSTTVVQQHLHTSVYTHPPPPRARLPVLLCMCVDLQLDLYGVAEHNNYEHKLMTLSDMLFELLQPYGEVRLGSASPSDEQAFYLTHGETSDSLKVRTGCTLPALEQGRLLHKDASRSRHGGRLHLPGAGCYRLLP